MKVLFKFYVLILIFCAFSVSAKEKTPFPKYSEKMTSAFGCHCNGMFSSCSGSGNCSCSCGYFTCSCSSDSIMKENAISISKEQFKNIELLVDKLKDLNALKARGYLANIVESVRDSDMKTLKESRANYLKELSRLGQKSKKELNEFFKSIGATEVV